jgi:hypothetical protein
LFECGEWSETEPEITHVYLSTDVSEFQATS